MEYLVLGSINMDLVIRGYACLRPGETTLGGSVLHEIRGEGSQSGRGRCLCRPRPPVTFVAAVGDDAYGREVR